MPDVSTGVFEYELHNLPGLSASGDLSAKQYHFMKHNGAGQVAACDTLGEMSLGILQDAPTAADRVATVAYGTSLCPCVASAAIARGALVTTTATGRAATAAAGQRILGQAMTPAGANGDLFTVRLLSGGAVAS